MLILSQYVDARVRLTIPGELMKDGQPLVMEVMPTKIRGSVVKIGYDGPRAIKVQRLRVSDGIPKVSNSP